MNSDAVLELDDLAERVIHSAPIGRRILVGIDGHGASGKSTLAELLAARIGESHVIHVDDFYLPSDQRLAGRQAHGHAFDLRRLASQVLIPAVRGDSVSYQRYDWVADDLADWIEVPARIPLIVEGVYSLEASLQEGYTFRIVCQAEHGIRLARGIERDGEAARGQWVDDWMPAEDAYFGLQQPALSADIVVRSDGNHEGYLFHVVSDPGQD